MATKIFAELSGELSGAICLKTLVLLASTLELFRKFFGAVRAILWLWGSFLALEKCIFRVFLPVLKERLGKVPTPEIHYPTFSATEVFQKKLRRSPESLPGFVSEATPAESLGGQKNKETVAVQIFDQRQTFRKAPVRNS